MTESIHVMQPPKEIHKPFPIDTKGIPCIAVPKGYQVQSAEHLLGRPLRDTRCVNVIDVESLCRYLSIHKTERAAVHVNARWPDANAPQELAIGFCDDGNGSVTSWRDHRVALVPLLSQDFRDWREVDGEELSQLDLVRFLDRHLHNIVQPESNSRAPSAAEVMTFAANLSDVKKVEFKKSVNLDNGRVQLTYNELDDDGATANITVPKEFWIQLQPIVGRQDTYQIRVSLRYRIADSAKLIFTLEMRDLQPLLEEMREEIVKELRDKVAPTPVFLTR